MAKPKKPTSKKLDEPVETVPAEPDLVVKPKSPKAEAAPVVDRRPTLTAKQMFRASPDPLVAAFLHVEGLTQKRTRKLPREDWDDLFQSFCKAPR